MLTVSVTAVGMALPGSHFLNLYISRRPGCFKVGEMCKCNLVKDTFNTGEDLCLRLLRVARVEKDPLKPCFYTVVD